MIRTIAAFAFCAAWSVDAAAQEPVAPEPVQLWPNGAPGALGTEAKDRPSLRPYVPVIDLNDPTLAERPAVVVCPGGGYGHLATVHEGVQIATWLNSLGIAAFVLDYRHREKGYGHPAPLLDVQRALRIVRTNAMPWLIDTDKVGVIGFSAGGHLAACVSVHHDAGEPTASDPVERQSSRPDFAILCYPVIAFGSDCTHRGSQRNLLGDNPPAELVLRMSCERQVAATTPPTFLWHTADDPVVSEQNSLGYYQALRAHGVPAELHVFASGPHGLGLAKDHPASVWPVLCRSWLVERRVLPHQ